ncbi:MAG: hypothetical protein ACYSU8_09970 [Planctomycetota bacterium]
MKIVRKEALSMKGPFLLDTHHVGGFTKRTHLAKRRRLPDNGS